MKFSIPLPALFFIVASTEIAFSLDELPLQHGQFVETIVPCSQASNATILTFNGREINSSREERKILQISRRESEYSVVLEINTMGRPGGQETWGLFIETPTKLHVSSPYGDKSYRWCSTGNLEANSGSSPDHSVIYGRWQEPGTPCNQGSFDSWYIDANGVTGYESTCTIISKRKSGNTFVFKQECDFGMESSEIEQTEEQVTILSDSEITINGSPYRRCPPI